MVKPGERVFAVESSDATSVRLYGFGKYVGDETPPGFEEIPWYKNPKILLDDGSVVWGMQCWWGPEHRYPEVRGTKIETRVQPTQVLPDADDLV